MVRENCGLASRCLCPPESHLQMERVWTRGETVVGKGVSGLGGGRIVLAEGEKNSITEGGGEKNLFKGEKWGREG